MSGRTITVDADDVRLVANDVLSHYISVCVKCRARVWTKYHPAIPCASTTLGTYVAVWCDACAPEGSVDGPFATTVRAAMRLRDAAKGTTP